MQGVHQFGKLLHKVAIIAGEIQKPPQLCHVGWTSPFSHSLNLWRISWYPFSRYDMAQILSKITHLLNLTLSPSCTNQFRSTSKHSRCWATGAENMITLFRFKSKNCHCWSPNNLSINLWNVPGTLHRPKGIWFHSKSPKGVYKTVLNGSFSVTGIWLYPLAKFRVENQQAPLRESRDSSVWDKVNTSFFDKQIDSLLY